MNKQFPPYIILLCLVFTSATLQAAQEVKVRESSVEFNAPSISHERLKQIMDEAKKAMTGGEYRRAVQLYTKVLRYPEFSKEAQELLGLARERNKQYSHASAEYKEFLRIYPDGVDADRVRQRLAGLETAWATPREKLRKARKKKDATKFYGSFSQFYNHYESNAENGDNVVHQSSLYSDLDLNFSRYTSAYDMSFVFFGGYDYDFIDDDTDNEATISQLYLDGLDKQRHLFGRIGRQSRSTDGVLGRFDGGVLSYQLLPQLNVNGLAGLPVYSKKLEDFDTDKYFYALSFDLGTFAKHWDFNIYAIEQKVKEVTDRQAVGGEVRYFDRNRSFFSYVDYDIYYSELNILMFVGNWIFPDKTKINTVVNYRTSPILTTSNAIMGQSVDSVLDLLKTLTEDEVRDLALDRTATSRSFTLGLTRPLNQKYQVSGDFTVSELIGTDASGGVEAVPGTGYEYFYSAQLIGSSLITTGDIGILGFRYYDTSTSDTISMDINTRYPMNREWRVNPRIRVDYRMIDQDDVVQLKIRPSLRTDYFWSRRVRLEFDGGVDWYPDWVSSQTSPAYDYFLTVGYRVYF